ncbi:hypothetical protein ACC668_32825, partial [Rhizobium ruizarguesonis]
IGKSISPTTERNAWTARRVAERSTVRFISWPQEVGCECGACENLNVLIIASKIMSRCNRLIAISTFEL